MHRRFTRGFALDVVYWGEWIKILATSQGEEYPPSQTAFILLKFALSETSVASL